MRRWGLGRRSLTNLCVDDGDLYAILEASSYATTLFSERKPIGSSDSNNEKFK